jgi:hypothetical protein
MQRLIWRVALAAVSLGIGCAGSSPAAQAGEKEVCREVEVTGSRIPREECELTSFRTDQGADDAATKHELEIIQRNGARSAGGGK